MELKEIRAVIEALLFVSGEPLSVRDVSNVLEIDENTVKKIMNQMIDIFNDEKRGIVIIEVNGSYQFSTRPDLFSYIEKHVKPNTKQGLSQAALEALAVVAYKQPVTRSEIESIRGVKCDTCIAKLVEKDLIIESGRAEGPGRPILYSTTNNFLRLFGLKSISELPPVNMFSKNDIDELEDFEQEDLFSKR